MAVSDKQGSMPDDGRTGCSGGISDTPGEVTLTKGTRVIRFSYTRSVLCLLVGFGGLTYLVLRQGPLEGRVIAGVVAVGLLATAAVLRWQHVRRMRRTAPPA